MNNTESRSLRDGSSTATDNFPKSPFVCDVCEKAYTRSDHLSRHYRSHTLEKPFICETCGKGFARRDLLRRHHSNHNSNGSQSKSLKGPVRHRTTRACNACAEAKLRCSDSYPCNRCVAKGISCEVRVTATVPAQRDILGLASSMESLPQVDSVDPSRQYNSQHQRPESRPQLHSHVAYADQEALALPQSSGTRNSGRDGSSLESICVDQLPTPLSAPYNPSNLIYLDPSDPEMEVSQEFSDNLMGSFLRDIVYQESVDGQFFSNPGMFPDVLNFGFDEMLDIPPSLFGRSSSLAPAIVSTSETDQNSRQRSRGGTETPGIGKAIHMGEQAFKDSMWLWTPSLGDHQNAEQLYLALSNDQLMTDDPPDEVDHSLQFSQMSRDRLLSMTLRTCEPHVQRHVVSCFPSTGFLSSLLTNFKTRCSHRVSSWIHFPTLEVDKECEEFLAALVCYSAADSREPDVRKLGFAMQEVARTAIASRFEEDNRNTRDLRTSQAFLLMLDVGLWSGTRRKIEIAESFTLPLVTMLRRSGRFRNRPDNLSESSYDMQTLETRWKKWVREESFKRLVYQVLLHDAQTSMGLLRQPTLSYSEINLPMPCSQELWEATTPEAWQQLLLSMKSESNFGQPTVRECLQEPGLLGTNQTYVDVQMGLRIMVSTFWLRVWQCLQMRAAFAMEGSPPNLVTVNSFHQELVSAGQDFILRASEWPGAMNPSTRIMLELCLMHLHVSLEDIQLLAGKEGEEEARRTVSHLLQWTESSESRHALFHAGQALKAASECPPEYLRGFNAVGIYHASLIMWAHALLATSRSRSQGQVANVPSIHVRDTSVRLDGEETPELRRYILLGKGKPCIRCSYDVSHNTNRDQMVPLAEASKVMGSIVGLLTSRNGNERSCPPIVSNLTKLMQSLANASAGMKRPRST